MKKYWLLFLALAIGAFLRLYQLGSLPNALTWDEAALGYNAFSIFKTGRDEFGKFLPLIFKSFGDYKPGFYVYLAVPSVAIFGLTEFAVRLPSALAGILAIFGVYLLTKELFKSKNRDLTSDIYDLIPQLSALFLAVMPWHIHFSRGAWETNVFVTLLLFSLYFLLKFIHTGRLLNYSLAFAILTFITYQAAKLLTPLILLLPIIIYWPDFRPRFREYFSQKTNRAFIAFCLAFFISFFISTATGEAGNRLKRLSIFGYRPRISQELRDTDNFNETSLRLFHNQPQLTIRLIASRYLKHFSPGVLFYEGAGVVERGHVPDIGALLPFDFIWLILGVVFLIQYIDKKSAYLLAGILLLSPIPGSLTLSEYSTIRSLFTVIPLAIILGAGAYFALQKIKYLFVPVALISLLGFLYFADLLFVHAKYTYAKEFQYGYKEAMEFINQYPDNKVVITDVLGQPYIFYLFYSRFNPAEYQKINDFQSGGYDVGFVGKVGRAEFHQSGLSEVMALKKTILVGTIGNFPLDFDFSLPTIEKHVDILYPNGDIALRIIKTKD